MAHTLEQTLAWLGGTACCRGQIWAERVWRKTRIVEPWPMFEGKCARIAREKVADMTSAADEREELARLCYEAARRRWEELRAGSTS